jgi:aminoglycoside 6'-N-acetyltransferase I
MAEPVIRQLGADDHAAWARLRHALWPDEPAAALQAELVDMVAHGLVGFGAFDGDHLLGFAEFSERLYGDGCDTAPVAWLEGIYNEAPARRRGLGRRLVAAGEAWALARGFSELGSDAEFDNLISRLSHARWGLEETGRVVHFRKVLR